MILNCGANGAGNCPACQTKKSLHYLIKASCQIILPADIANICAVIGVSAAAVISTFITKAIFSSPVSTTSKFVGYQLMKPDELKLFNVPVARKMIGDSEVSNNMIADENGSLLWPKNLAYITLGPKEDELYYSLCSSKIINATVGVVKNFNSSQDIISFFCSKEEISLNELHIVYRMFGDEYTCIEIRDSAVCLMGHIELELSDIGITNKTYVDSLFAN